MKNTRKLPLQKAAKGLHQVSVPPPGNSGDVLNSALQGGLAGSQFGPIGGFLGGLGGLGMGLLQSSQQDAANQQALKRNQFVKANELVDGYDPTSVQRGQYAQGTEEVGNHKPIEVEKDELVFRKVGDKFRLKADFQKGKSHSQGGEEYLAAEGDVIFPGKQRGKVLAAYQEGNHAKLEGMRVKLPRDTNPEGKAAMGVDGTDPNSGMYTDPYNKRGKYGQYGQALDQGNYLSPFDPANPYQGNGVLAYQPQGQPKPTYYAEPKGLTPITPRNSLDGGVGNGFQIPSSLAPLSGVGVTSPSTSPASNTGPETALGGEGMGLGNALKYASVASNLIQGFSTPEKVPESYLDPVLNQYSDRSAPQRRQSTMVRNAQVVNARNASGGSVSNLRSNQQIAEAENYGRRQEIDNREQGRADDIRASNVGIVNQTNSINSQKRDQYNQLNGQARANAQAYKDAAFGQLSSLGNAMEQEGYLRSRDAKLDARDQTYLKYLNQTTHYTTDGKGTVDWNPNGVGYQSTKTQDTQSTTVDSKGNTRTTTKRKLKRSL
ncbi:hypothetical protein Q5H92_14785 [Hymenobacter sp. M29]|uniref:DUF3945 domain-containing protein n=1 Tax=Hymenobacter mellowenesis TaxID=3063995 RepID=A0ABT9ACP7_9BACT|nr:hypothetical protein [Hymenobacter sp. M29]MDO7847632.1 hypothetical protein [Hymenobacter sp. M29]